MSTLHLIDPTTPRDGMEMLAALIAPNPADHAVLVLGHAKFLRAAIRLGIPGDLLTHVHSMGWADVSAWRAVRRAIRAGNPPRLHAWGLRGIAAAAMVKSFQGQRLATLAAPLLDSQIKLLRFVHRRAAFTFTASSKCIQSQLTAAGLPHVRLTRPAITPAAPLTPDALAFLRKQLGIQSDDFPIILLGGEHETATRPHFALWSAGILSQLFPRTRIIVRSEDEWSRPTPSTARLFAHRLPLTDTAERMALFAPPELPWPTLLQLADIFLLTPDAPITTGSILHAQAAGVPVIATDLPCTRELIEHKVTGLLATPRQPRSITARLEEWLATPEIHEDILLAAKQQILTRFTSQNMLEQFDAIYTSSTLRPRVNAS